MKLVDNAGDFYKWFSVHAASIVIALNGLALAGQLPPTWVPWIQGASVILGVSGIGGRVIQQGGAK